MKNFYFVSKTFILLILVFLFACASQTNNGSEDILSKESKPLSNTEFQDNENSKTSELQKNNIDEEVKLTSSEYIKKGKSDTIVIELDINNRLFIPNMHPGVYAKENPTSAMFKPHLFVKKHDRIKITLNEITGIDGEIVGNNLIFQTNNDFKIINIYCNAFANIFFNSDGSGGMWSEYADTEYGKENARHDEENTYSIPLFEGIEEVIPSELIEKAIKKTKENSLLKYETLISKVDIEIIYSIKGKKYTKHLIFNYEFGD